EEVDDGHLKNTVIRLGEFSFAMDAVLLGFLFPLVVFVHDTYLGLSGGSWLLYGVPSSCVVLALVLVIIHFLNACLVKRDVILLKENEKTLFWKNHRYNTWSGIVLVVLLLFTILLHLSLTEMWGPLSVMDGTVFDDTDSFVAFMETEVPEPRMVYGPAAPLYGEEEEYDVTYYDEDGNVVTKEEAWRQTLTDRNGKEILSYVQWNRNVLSISWVPKDGSVLPITVYTYDDYREAEHTVKERNLVFGFVYALEILLFAVGYGLLRRKTLR
ncbi:MAG: hypothetical protein KBS81_07710, partial [Spirochaetales bacterium]|nr:hypothetical protein [Candidatus Physcosoma equi]